MRSPRTTLVAFASAAALLLTTVPSVAAVDTQPPETTIFTGPGATSPTWVTIAFRGFPADDTDHVECRLDGGEWLVPCPDPWELTLPGGLHVAEGRAVDAAGNADATPEVIQWVVDDVGPIGTVSINQGAPSTGRAQVHLTLDNTDGHWPEMRVSNSPAVDANGLLREAWVGYQWQFANGDNAWRLDNADYGGTSDPGPRSVYVQWTDGYGNVGPVTSDTILFTPGITRVIVSLGPTENPAVDGERIGVRATVVAEDGAALRDGQFELLGCLDGNEYGWGTGQRKIVLECDATAWGPGTHHVQAHFGRSDELAAASAAFDLTIRPATSVPPITTVLEPRGGLYPETTSATLDVVPSRAASASQCRIDENPWIACGPTWTLAHPGAGLHRLQARSRDAAGVWGPASHPVVWSGAYGTVGGWFAHPAANGGVSAFPVELVHLFPGDAIAVRLSASGAVDADGRLLHALHIDAPTYGQGVEFDIEAAANGGTPGDGLKWFTAQFQGPDGVWDTPSGFAFVLDRQPPPLRLVVNAAVPWVDGDDVLVLPKTEKWAMTYLSEDPASLEGHLHPHGGGIVGYGVWSFRGIAPGEVAKRTLYARAVDLAGNEGEIVSATITIDRSSPTGSLAAPTFVVGSTVSWTSVPVRLAATAKDTGSGVARTSLQEAVGAKPFGTVATSGGASTAAVRTLDPRVARAYRVRGTDRLGHVGAWNVGPMIDPYLADDGARSVRLSGSWTRVTRPGALGGRVLRTTTAGAKTTFSFTGRAIGLVAPRSPGLGRVAVYVDGNYVATVDLRASSTQGRRVVFARSWSSPGAHTITVKALATSGRPTVMLDGFVALP